MTFDEVLDQVRELLQSKDRVAYRALKRRFELDDEYLEDLKAELIKAEGVAVDENGEVLVWAQKQGAKSTEHGAKQEEEERSKPQSASLAPRSLLPASQAAAERRQLTVMFCDLVGSTALSAQLDPEELRTVVRAYQETCTAVIRRYEGHIAQHLGDGLLVYFGYPTAHEDDAARAVRAGLEIITAIRKKVPSPVQGEGQGEGAVGATGPLRYRETGAQSQWSPLQVRIGIHTGLVVIGEIGSSEKREMLALGETPNIAARIQGQANPDEVIISAATYRLIEGLFATEDRGQPELKGVATPLTLYRVVKETEAHSRFEVVVRKGLTPLIGREHEIGLLRERWERVKDGTGQVVLLSGEPGIGKSRLVEALKESVEHEESRFLELRCSPYAQNSALQPIIEHLQRTLHFRPGDSVEEKLRKLEQALKRKDGAYGLSENSQAQVIASAAKQSLPETEIASSPTAPRNDTTHLQETVPLFATLLSLPHPDGYPVLTFSLQKQKEKTHEALVGWLCAEAQQQAVTYAWEDLHWADPSTLELLTLFLHQVPTTRLLALFTYRPEFTPPWGAHSYLSQLTLSRLGRTQVETMVEKVTGGKALPREVIQQIVNKTDGVPLFVEELTKSVVESVGATGPLRYRETGAQSQWSPLQSLDIPATLQDSLMARLDRLGTAKEIAQLGATLGREFTYELLRAVSPLQEDILQQELKQLVESELVYQSGVPPQARYLFKHALVQDTAYQSLLKSRRQQLHQTIGKVLEAQFPQTVETQPELVAHHYTEANLIEQAIPYWQKAGQRAAQHSANVEAINHLTKGLELVKTLADTPEHAQLELTLQTVLGASLMATKGYAAAEVAQAYTRTRELCQRVGETPQLVPVLWGLTSFYGMNGEIQTAREVAEQLMQLAQNTQDPAALILAHRVYGAGSYWHGELISAREHLEQVLTLYDRQQHHSQAFLLVTDSGVHCRGYLAGTLWCLGYLDQAQRRLHEALALARDLSHSNSLAYVLNWGVKINQLRRDVQAVQEQAEALMALSTTQELPFFLAVGTLGLGWLLLERGQREEGMEKIRQGLMTKRAVGAGLEETYWLVLLAEACGKMGQTEEGLTVVAEALALIDKSELCVFEAELYRIKGELVLQSGVRGPESENPSPQHLTPSTQAEAEAEAYFLKAIDIARKQQAKSLELRAAMSLARLWQQQDKKAEAHKLLSDVYNWFTEGFDTKDLQEAKILLEELS